MRPENEGHKRDSCKKTALSGLAQYLAAINALHAGPSSTLFPKLSRSSKPPSNPLLFRSTMPGSTEPRPAPSCICTPMQIRWPTPQTSKSSSNHRCAPGGYPVQPTQVKSSRGHLHMLLSHIETHTKPSSLCLGITRRGGHPPCVPGLWSLRALPEISSGVCAASLPVCQQSAREVVIWGLGSAQQILYLYRVI